MSSNRLYEFIGKLIILLMGGFTKLQAWASDIPQAGFIVQWVARRGVLAAILNPSSKQLLRQTLEAESNRVMLPNIARYLQQVIDTKGTVEKDDLVALFQACEVQYFYTVPKRLALRKRGQHVWDLLPKERFATALEVIGKLDDYDQRLNWLLILLPSLAKRRPDLLSEFENTLKSFTHWEAPIVYASLAGYLHPENQRTMLEENVARVSRYDSNHVEWFIPIILGEAADYVPPELLPWLAQQFVKCHNETNISEAYFLAIQYFAHRIGADMTLMERLWPLILKMDYDELQQFILIVVEDLNATYISKLLLRLLREDREIEALKAYRALRKRWLVLEPDDKYLVWTKVVNELSTLSRHDCLRQLALLTPVIPEIGTRQSVVNVGDALLDVSGWRWTPIRRSTD